jgi:uncharacterized protein (TIGR02598 family)
MILRFTHGFSLVEVVLALGVVAFCLLAIMGLMSTGLGSNQAAVEQTEAASIATSIASDLRNTLGSSVASPQYDFAFPALGGTATQPNTVYFAEGLVPVSGSSLNPVNAAASTSPVSASIAPLFRADVTFSPPPAGQRTATAARIFITWPALTNPNPTVPPAGFAGSYEIMTALDRN